MSEIESLPISRDYNLGSIGRNGAEVVVDASEDDRAAIARWAGIKAVEKFVATIHLKKQSASRFSLQAELAAVVEQACVVTLEPVKATLELDVHRELHLSEIGQHLRNIELSEGAGDDEVPEEIEGLHYDLAAPLLEDFALALNPYPRAPGVEFAAPAEPEAKPESPFAVLKKLGKQT